MINIIKISFLDFYYMIKTRIFIILNILTVLAIFFISNTVLKKVGVSRISNVVAFCQYFLMVFFVSLAVAKDLLFKTSKFIFTGYFSRISVMFEKLMVVLLIGLFYGLLIYIITVVLTTLKYASFNFSYFLDQKALNYILISILYAFFVGSISLLMLSVKINGKNLLFINFFIFELNMWINEIYPAILKKVFEIPEKWIIFGNITLEQVLIISSVSISCYILSLLITEKVSLV
ncbi:hypothetical protein OSSY52_08090 [Tepiditoga spiralis]|uniref:ABC transporter permease n=1 Tax=Tepiditoga spiralis TaxID=2108365 RepID=A0A7G1G2V2_9BACT|nr:hypothetical protein [Tepiditoga spiralis]BBE30668.1 hypothetical protein OSSY52_08090 [Tepiditoga spiralis]